RRYSSLLLLLLHMSKHSFSTLFPYTTLFRSHGAPSERAQSAHAAGGDVRGEQPSDSALSSSAASCHARPPPAAPRTSRTETRHRSEEHTSELQSRENIVCRLLLEKKKQIQKN